MFRVLAIFIALAFSIFTKADGGQLEVDDLHARVVKASGQERAALEAQLDKACAQRDCVTSRLSWYTDLEEAQRAAAELRRPIISLHLLGRLDEELSCANSRFFRTMLYSDPSISQLLRDEFVLHWHSVRPVPRITIDFGDGRKIQQTITGNSVHYLLASNGQVLDALPGLHSPAAFREQLKEWVRLDQSDRKDLARYHEARANAATKRWRELSARTGIAIKTPNRDDSKIVYSAVLSSRAAMTKAAPERPLFAQIDMGSSLRMLRPDQWEALGESERGDVVFSPESIELIRRKQFSDGQPHAAEMAVLLANLRRLVASDTVFNQIELHRQIHSWFAWDQVDDLYSLNEAIYAELFLTPSDDPWMGLRTPTVFTAIGESSARVADAPGAPAASSRPTP